ncbi:MAG: tRNA adenosine(34) deaminase TadA [Planctomycetota bacterium]
MSDEPRLSLDQVPAVAAELARLADAAADDAAGVADDAHFMRLALREAMAAAALDEVPVGAVVVRAGQVIATGYNLRETRADPTAHAEIVALAAAGAAVGHWRLDECDLFVTLEPCPMCAGALVNSRIRRVVFGCTDPKAGACGSVVDLSSHPQLNHRYEVVGGVLAEACAQVLTAFFRSRRG